MPSSTPVRPKGGAVCVNAHVRICPGARGIPYGRNPGPYRNRPAQAVGETYPGDRDETMEQIQQRGERADGLSGVTSGFVDLDKITGGGRIRI